MMDTGTFQFNEVTIIPNMNTTLLEKDRCFQVVKLNFATIYICPKVRLDTVLFGLLVTARNNTIKQLELSMCDSTTAKKSLEEKYVAHNRFLKKHLGCNFKKCLGRIEYSFVWGGICSYMDIKTGECKICVEYF